MEMLLRAQFVLDRVHRAPRRAERKDLTEFARNDITPILQCSTCCALSRKSAEPDEEAYVEDEYDASAMEALLPRYVAAFRKKEAPYRTLLPPGATVLEVGPHFGAFLEVAREWGWQAQGVDIGKDTTEFVRAHGHTVHNATLEECAFQDAVFDGVFVWNCIEQIDDPRPTLAAARRVLRRGGLLVLRTPNALFYRECRRYLETKVDTELATAITRTLAYNNLLGWPYLNGYSDAHLDRLAQDFHRDRGLDADLLTVPFPDIEFDMVAEKEAAAAALRGWSALDRHAAAGELTGSWIEVCYRAA